MWTGREMVGTKWGMVVDSSRDGWGSVRTDANKSGTAVTKSGDCCG